MRETYSLKMLLKRDEITLKDIAIVLQVAVRAQIKLIIGIFLLFILVGVLDYSLSTKEYKSEATVLLESGAGASSNSANMLNGLLGASPKSGSGSGSISPEMYGKVVGTQAFLNVLVASKIPTDPTGRDSITLEQYFANGAPLSFSQKIKNIFSKQAPLKLPALVPPPRKIDTSKVVQNQISAEMFFSSRVPPLVQLEDLRASVISIMRPRINVKVEENSALVSVQLPDQFLAASVNKLLLQQLIDYVTAYNTIKQRTNIAFLEKRFQESKDEYTSKQQRLAGVRDNSYGVILQSAQTRQEVLLNDLNVAFNIYNQFAVQLETAKIELKKETPLFTVLEPISLPSPQIEPVLTTKLVKYILYAIIFAFLLIGYRLLIPKKN